MSAEELDRLLDTLPVKWQERVYKVMRAAFQAEAFFAQKNGDKEDAKRLWAARDVAEQRLRSLRAYGVVIR